jgi:hypothetical protein
MEPNEPIQPQLSAGGGKAHKQEDVKCLWEKWDKVREDAPPSDLVKGPNLLGIGLIMAGALCQVFGTGMLQYRVAPLIIVIGAGIIAVRKFRTLWLQRSLDN